MTELTGRLAEIVAEFAESEPRERLELLRDYADAAPAMPEEYRAARDAGLGRVPECMSPVFMFIDVVDGHVQIVAEAAPEAPTVRGFVALLLDALNGAPVADVLSLPANLVQQLGLVEVLGMNRMHGLHGILHRIGAEVKRKSDPAT